MSKVIKIKMSLRGAIATKQSKQQGCLVTYQSLAMIPLFSSINSEEEKF